MTITLTEAVAKNIITKLINGEVQRGRHEELHTIQARRRQSNPRGAAEIL